MLELIECPHEWCDEAAEVTDRYELASTGGLVIHFDTRCVLGHVFKMMAQGGSKRWTGGAGRSS